MAKEFKVIDYDNDRVECNLCHRWMKIAEYDRHYGKCLDIEYLVNIAKQKGENIIRQDLEDCRQDVIDKLLVKYEPKGVELWHITQ